MTLSTAFSHDWLNGMRGGEKCLEVLCELYPESPIHTLFYEKGKVSDTIARHSIHTSRLQRFPGVFTHYRHYLPFFTAAMEGFKLKGFDLVVSTSHCVAKGIRKNPGAVHVCYCFTPVRYVWGFFDEYFGKKDFISKSLIRSTLRGLKRWDLKANADVDHFVAISGHVKKRIEQYYARPADVIYPPVDTHYYTPDETVEREDFYLVVSALVPYKRVELAVQAFSEIGRRLVVIGSGPESASLMRLAGPRVEFLGWQPDERLRDYYRKARALIFPGEEDFGIVPLEMQACGGFVIAYGKGGAAETVTEGKTGLFFNELSVAAIKQAVEVFETLSPKPVDSVLNAARFSRERFKAEIRSYLDRVAR